MSMIIKQLRILFAMALSISAAQAHDFWLDADSLRPVVGSELALYVRGGHYFPSSALALPDRFIRSFAITSSTVSEEVHSTRAGKERVARIRIREPAPHRVNLTIMRPQLEQPEAWARLLLVPANGGDDPSAYAEGAGLEIVPRTPLSSARVGAAMQLDVLRDGTSLPMRFQIQAAAGGTTWIESRADQPASFTPRRAGRHLAIAQVGPQTVTLVFEVQP